MPKENDAYRNNFNLERFIREHFASLCAMAYKLVGDQDTAQDIAQEVIIKFWENQKHDQPPESIDNYLYIMILNVSLNYLRTLSREQKRHEKAYQELKILKFESYSEEWLDFILKCRSGNDTTDYDIVIGGVANDKVFNTIELYFDNLINKGEAIRRLRYEKPNLQICFRTQYALDEYLHYEGSEQI